MARGWESKAIESQIEDSGQPQKRRRALSPEERQRVDARALLALSRSRVVRELDTCRADGHRATLERALAHLDAELSKLAK